MLVLSRKVDQTIVIEPNITIRILEINGDRVKLGINAPRDVVILRQELQEEVRQENLRAATKGEEVGPLLGAVGDALAGRQSRVQRPAAGT
ncbi:MAG TPA: carbon storage regulator CsrA [Chloroflexota bacterium]|nr:carbon storage regulator CsrA [Chloroflexota bacterium]